MEESNINAEKVIAEIKENLTLIQTIGEDNLTEEEITTFKKELAEAKELALAIKRNRS